MGAGFIPGGLIATFAHATTLGTGRRSRRAGKRRKRRTSTGRRTIGLAAPRTRSASSARSSNGAKRGRGKPRPGTKAWMAYIRGMRGKKRRRAK